MTLDRLSEPGWQRLLNLARRRLERIGGDLTGSVTLGAPTEPERRLIIGITGRHRAPDVRSVTVPMAALNAAVRDVSGMELSDALAELYGPLRNRPAERSDEQLARQRAIADAPSTGGRHAGQEWFERWLAEIEDDGTVTRLVRRADAEHLHWAASVLAHLPADGLALPVLAERATGNTKALSATPAATLVLRALAGWMGTAPPTSAATRRALWDSSGVIVDDLSSQVLVLGLRPPQTHVVAGWLREAAETGLPFRLTLHQLRAFPISLLEPDVYVCENPAVLRVVSSELGAHSAPLICTEGQPSTACHQILAAATGRIHWRGDFDWTGLRTTAAAITRYGAQPWRMSAQDYLSALNAPLAETEALKGAPAPSPWDPDLAIRLTSRGRAVMEERLIPLLVCDLNRSSG